VLGEKSAPQKGASAVDAERWVGIDQGYSHMGLAVIDADGRTLASERTREPAGDGHEPDVALRRLRVLLGRVAGLRDGPVRLAGFCHEGSGVPEVFAEAGVTVRGTKALNDVVGVYGITEMRGHVVVAGCGTYSQVVYVDEGQAVCWPGDDVAAQLPQWLLFGGAYARFVAERRGGEEPPPRRWAELGPLLSDMLHDPAAREFLTLAATALAQTRDVFWRETGVARPPDLVLGGGAVADPRVWAALSASARALGVGVERAQGDPAVGLARFAMVHPDADPWAFIGRVRPGWLS